MFEGKKTYVVAFCVILAVLAKQYGYLNEESYQTILGVLGAAGLTTLRMGMNKNA